MQRTFEVSLGGVDQLAYLYEEGAGGNGNDARTNGPVHSRDTFAAKRRTAEGGSCSGLVPQLDTVGDADQIGGE